MCNNCLSLNSVYRIDPTRTLTLRKNFASKMGAKFNTLKSDIRTSIVKNDAFALKTNAPLGKEQFKFVRDPEKIVLFLEWLQRQIDQGILESYYGRQVGTAVEQAWTNRYIRLAYEKGIDRAQNELKAKGYVIPESATVATSMSLPIHIDRIGLLYTRTFTGLKGITDEMSKQIAEVLSEGMAFGDSPYNIAKNIVNRVDKIGITRAKILARTEVIRAHHQAMVNEFKNWGIIGVRVLAEWRTAGDGRVCDICKRIARKDNGYGSGVYLLDQVEGMIPVHPQCRCIIIPLDITDNEELLERVRRG